MTVEQRLHDLEEQLASQKLVMDTLLQNLLGPTLMLPGTLRTGGNVMQLDQSGMQLRNNSSTTVNAIRIVPDFSVSPSTTFPHATFGGYALSSGPTAVGAISAVSDSLLTTRAQIVSFAAGTTGATRRSYIQLQAALPSVREAGLLVNKAINSSGTVTESYIQTDGLISPYYEFAAISSGELDVTTTYVLVSPESGTADNLDTITPAIGSTIGVNPIVILRPLGASDAITITGSGNIVLPSACTLTGYTQSIVLQWDYFQSKWYELSRSQGGGMNKVTGSGYLVHPAAATGIDPGNSGSAWTSGSWSQVVASTAQAQSIIGIIYGWDGMADNTRVEAEIDIGTGAAAAEVAVATIPCQKQQHHETGASSDSGDNSIDHRPLFFPAPIEIATSTRIAVRVRSSSTTIEPADIKLIYVKTTELVAR
jgi:hypothetical protein